MIRRRTVAAVAGGVLALGVGAGAAAMPLPLAPGVLGEAPATSQAAAADAPPATASVERRTLAISEVLDGSLGFDGSWTISAGGAGTITKLPAAGTVVERGEHLYELDARRRGVLLYGSRPAWRTLSATTSSRGSDVRQLEENLQALGHLKAREVDGRWDADTTAAVKRLERATRLSVDGRLDMGDVVFLAGPVRVADHEATVGAVVGPGAPVLALSTTTTKVTIELAVSKLPLVAAGDPVSVRLPDGTRIEGTVRSIGRTVTAPDTSNTPFGDTGGDPTVVVIVELADPEAAAAYDAAPVAVTIVREAREDALAVPVQALVALVEGGYALEVVADDGSTSLVAVEPGLFDDGWVEVRGDVREGQRVVVAA